MKAFHVTLFDRKVTVKEGIRLSVYEWRDEDPHISLGTRYEVYPPLLFCKIEAGRLLEIDNTIALSLMEIDRKTGRRMLPTFNKGLSLESPGDKFLVAFEVGHLARFLARDFSNCILLEDDYSGYEKDFPYCTGGILAILASDGGSIGAITHFNFPEEQKFLLKTENGEIHLSSLSRD